MDKKTGLTEKQKRQTYSFLEKKAEYMGYLKRKIFRNKKDEFTKINFLYFYNGNYFIAQCILERYGNPNPIMINDIKMAR